jgi:hypothetical protein
MPSNQFLAKYSNILTSIPILGQPAALIAKGALILFGAEEASSHLHFDPINMVNPIKWVSEPVRHIIGACKDYDEGIWIGKRSLGKHGIAFTNGPGIDVYHYAIMIDGTVFHIQGTKEEKHVFYVEISDHRLLKNSFVWYPTSSKKCKNQRGSNELKKYAKELERSNKYSVVPVDDETENCQTFVIEMLRFASKLSPGEAKFHVILAVGTILG